MGDRFASVRVAAVQAAPVVLEREATLERVLLWVRRAAEREACLVVFPESFVPAYPASPVFGPLFGGFFEPLAGALFERLAANAVVVPGPDTQALGQAAREASVYLSIGVSERTPSGTLHCTLLLFGPTGELLQVRRKLTPTHDERMVWGAGPAVGAHGRRERRLAGHAAAHRARGPRVRDRLQSVRDARHVPAGLRAA
jgi:nitrilase